MSKEQPEAHRLAGLLRKRLILEVGNGSPCDQAADMLESQHARIAELEGQLAAIGAGGVEPLRKQTAEAK